MHSWKRKCKSSLDVSQDDSSEFPSSAEQSPVRHTPSPRRIRKASKSLFDALKAKFRRRSRKSLGPDSPCGSELSSAAASPVLPRKVGTSTRKAGTPTRKVGTPTRLDGGSEASEYHDPFFSALPFPDGVQSSPPTRKACREEVESPSRKIHPLERGSTVSSTYDKGDEEGGDRPRTSSVVGQHPFYELHIHLKSGANLVARDTCGTSDPYVKFKVGGKQLYKSRIIYKDLNPHWDEYFTLPIEDPFEPVGIKVFDYDWGFQDDFMGSAELYLSKMEINKPQDYALELAGGPGKAADYMGELHLTATLYPKSQEDRDEYLQKGLKGVETVRRLKSQIWNSVVTVVLVEAGGFHNRHNPDPYTKFRLGMEKYRSKTMPKTATPRWLEQFDLHLYEDQSQLLEVTLWDYDLKSRDEFLGRCTIDLSALDREKTHKIRRDLEEGGGAWVLLLVTISGTTKSETIADMASHEDTPEATDSLLKRYSIWRSMENLRDVGHLTVKVFYAQGLAAADLGGKSDPFCVLELVNARLQTQTEYKTLCPKWEKLFTFHVKDIHSVLEVTVYDEDRDNKVDFLGKVVVPLLSIRNGERRWYALKDKKLTGRAKGSWPQIYLEMNLVYNPIRASVRTFNPKEEKYTATEQKFNRHVFLRNVTRLRDIAMSFVETSKFVGSCLEWESPSRSISAFIVFLVVTYFFEFYMIPVALLLLFLKNYLLLSGTSPGPRTHADDDDEFPDDEGDEEDDKEEKKTLKERLQAIQEVTQTVQNVLGYIASLGERIANTFAWTVPFLSWLAIVALAVATVILYLVPTRWLVLAWGINKFAKKLVRPHSINNNELLDFLSRVPDSDELVKFRELRTSSSSQSDKRRDTRHKKTS